jgi:hypothetical protein
MRIHKNHQSINKGGTSMKYIILIFLSLAMLAGCSQSMRPETSSSYPSAIAWNDSLYGLSVTEVPVQEIGKGIGKIDRKTNPMPKKNGESNDKPVGSQLYEIKGKESQEIIAVKVYDKYFQASKLGPLK